VKNVNHHVERFHSKPILNYNLTVSVLYTSKHMPVLPH